MRGAMEMLFRQRKSVLARLSDCLKLGLADCEAEAKHVISLHRKYAVPLAEIRRLADLALSAGLPLDTAEAELGKASASIPSGVAQEAVVAREVLHTRVLSVVLNCCSCLESYINALAYHLFHESDVLGLIREGHNDRPSLRLLSLCRTLLPLGEGSP
jgi:hypothetical protein